MSSRAALVENDEQLLVGLESGAVSAAIAIDRDASLSEVLDDLELISGDTLELLDRSGLRVFDRDEIARPATSVGRDRP